MEFSQLASQLASQLFPEEKEESLPNLLCNEQLSNVHQNAITDSHVDYPMNVGSNIIADSQAGEEDFLWKNRRFGNQWKLREVSRLIVDSSCDEENVGSNIPEVVIHTDAESTPESKKVHVHAESGASSRSGTPFRSGLKAAVVASSIFDAIKSEEKKQEGSVSSSNSSNEKRRAPKKGMVASRDILSYFSPRKIETKWIVCENKQKIIRQHFLTLLLCPGLSWRAIDVYLQSE